MMAASSCHVVDGSAEFNPGEVQRFFNNVNMEGVGRDYQVIAIMGPQSSGKSTLLNSVVSGEPWEFCKAAWGGTTS